MSSEKETGFSNTDARFARSSSLRRGTEHFANMDTSLGLAAPAPRQGREVIKNYVSPRKSAPTALNGGQSPTTTISASPAATKLAKPGYPVVHSMPFIVVDTWLKTYETLSKLMDSKDPSIRLGACQAATALLQQGFIRAAGQDWIPNDDELKYLRPAVKPNLIDCPECQRQDLASEGDFICQSCRTRRNAGN